MNNTVLSNFIVFEGLDGSGTTTQMELLARRLSDGGAKVFATCEPSRGPVGEFVRRILRHEIDVDPCTLAHLFAADRNEHLYRPADGMASHLEQHEVVVCDRYLYSSLAYQSIGCSFDFVRMLNARFPLPEYLIFLDVSPAECQRRLAVRPGIELFEGSEIQDRIIQNYERALAEFQEHGMHIVRVDGADAIEAVAENIWSELRRLPIHKM